ncbi:MAG TPA: hypothetical protein VFA51_07215 [Candidatus Udaeobacter sp.]|nr:hypothetical protein [Candidatus Udaeobacter sp.]
MNEKSSEGKVSGNAAVEAAADLRGCHPLVSQTKRALEKAKAGETLLLWSREQGILNVEVTRGSLHRALRIMQAIIEAALSRGWVVKGCEERKGCAIVIGEDDLHIRMIEKIIRFEIPPDKGTEGWHWKRYRHEATGLLTLEITDYLDKGTRRTWSDGKRKRLEDVLGEFIEGVAAAAQILQRRRIERAKWNRRWEEEQRQREELERRIKAEKQRRETLLEQVNWYQQAATLRKLIAGFQSVSGNLPPFWTEEARARWISWAQRLSNFLDPFSNGYFSEELAKTRFEPELDCRADRLDFFS